MITFVPKQCLTFTFYRKRQMTKIDKQKGSIYSKNSRWCPNVSEWFRFLYLPLTTFHAVLQSRTRHGNAPTSKALTFAGMQYVLRKKYLPKWLLQSLLNFSYAESHIPQVFQLTEAGNTRSRYQSKQKTVPSLQQLQETLATSTSPPWPRENTKYYFWWNPLYPI